MTTLTQGYQTGEFLLSEDDDGRSRSAVTATVAGNIALPSGTVLGKITATGKYIKRLVAAVDGSQTAAGVLYTNLSGAANGDFPAVVIDLDAEVIGAILNGGTGIDAAGTASLLALGIKVR